MFWNGTGRFRDRCVSSRILVEKHFGHFAATGSNSFSQGLGRFSAQFSDAAVTRHEVPERIKYVRVEVKVLGYILWWLKDLSESQATSLHID